MAAVMITGAEPPIYRRSDSDTFPTLSHRGAAPTTQVWTASRCHRILRPLLSHLAALRKEKARAAAKNASNDGYGPSTGVIKRPCATEDVASRKRVRYTYSLKGTRRQSKQRAGRALDASGLASTSDIAAPDSKSANKHQYQTSRYICPGEVLVATPVLTRAKKQRRSCSLPSSPISRHIYTKTTEEESGRAQHPPGKPSATRCDASFYRGYYHDPLHLGGSSSSSKHDPLENEWANLHRSTDPRFHPYYESIFRTVEALLRATAPEPSSNRKCGSLLDMCLRRVPQYMAECEEAEREEAKERGDTPPSSLPGTTTKVTLEVYSDLEGLGYGSGGWRHLRTVVRAHGVSLLRAACAENLLPFTFIRLLVRLLTRLRAYAESEELLSAVIEYDNAHHVDEHGHYPQPPDGVHSIFREATRPLASLQLLAQYSNETGRLSFLFRKLGDLLDHGVLPPAWLSTHAFSRVWEQVIRGISSHGVSGHSRDALFDFATTAITRLILSQPGDDLESQRPGQGHDSEIESSSQQLLSSSSSFNTFSSILGSLTAIVILQQEAACEDGRQETTEDDISLRHLTTIVQACLASTEQEQRRRGRRRKSQVDKRRVIVNRFLLGLTMFLSQCGDTGNKLGHTDEDTRGLDRLDRFSAWCRESAREATLEQRKQLYDATITLIASVSQSCGRAVAVVKTKSARDYLLQLCGRVSSRLKDCFFQDGDQYGMAERMQADGAFLLASRTNDLRDLAFAETLGAGLNQASTAHRSTTVLSPPHATPQAALFAGYRWEEGISEWVIASPKSEVCQQKGMARRTRDSDAGNDKGATHTATREIARKGAAMTRSLSLLLSPSPSVSAAPGSVDEENDNETSQATPRGAMTTTAEPTTPIRADSSIEWRPRARRPNRGRHGRASWPSWSRRETNALLNLVSDSEDEEDKDDGVALTTMLRVVGRRISGQIGKEEFTTRERASAGMGGGRDTGGEASDDSGDELGL